MHVPQTPPQRNVAISGAPTPPTQQPNPLPRQRTTHPHASGSTHGDTRVPQGGCPQTQEPLNNPQTQKRRRNPERLQRRSSKDQKTTRVPDTRPSSSKRESLRLRQ